MPIIELVDKLISTAIDHRVSDIHLEPYPDYLRVRWRIDGVLGDRESIEDLYKAQVLSRIKVLAHIDIAEKRLPHDGKFKVIGHHGQEIDLRISTFPGIHGEKIVIRILDRAHHMIALAKLGFSQNMQSDLEQVLQRANGFFLVSGPTGSGKTTTLYAALSHINSPEKNIITLEDPVEYSLTGITQSQIHPEAGFTFERGLRALLRQDPNILMIGEIRDTQTARVAIEASLTGHLVLSTIHTNDAPTVIMRLIDMGIESFLINAAVSGILAQRLVRTICSICRISYEPSEMDEIFLQKLGIENITLYRGIGCEKCDNLGYRGRIGIFEFLKMTPTLRELICKSPGLDSLVIQAKADGMRSLVQDGIEKVRAGVITLDELVRAVI